MSCLRLKPRFNFSFKPYINMLERKNACLGSLRVNQHYTPSVNRNYNKIVGSCHKFFQIHGLINTKEDLDKLNKVNALKFAAYALRESNSNTLKGYAQASVFWMHYDDFIEKVPINQANATIDDVLKIIQSIKNCDFIQAQNVYSSIFQQVMNYLFNISCYDNMEDYFKHPMTQYALDAAYKAVYNTRLTLIDRHENVDIFKYSFDDYYKLRAEDSGTMFGVCLPLCITQDKWFQSYQYMKSNGSENVISEILSDNIMKDLLNLVTKSSILDNDIMGFERELNSNDFMNYVIILANQLDSDDINQALEQTIGLNVKVKQQYITTRDLILKKYNNNIWLKSYLEILDAWVLNSMDWYLDTFRYSQKISL